MAIGRVSLVWYRHGSVNKVIKQVQIHPRHLTWIAKTIISYKRTFHFQIPNHHFGCLQRRPTSICFPGENLYKTYRHMFKKPTKHRENMWKLNMEVITIVSSHPQHSNHIKKNNLTYLFETWNSKPALKQLWEVSTTNSRGHYITNLNNALLQGKSPQNHHRFALFDPPQTVKPTCWDPFGFTVNLTWWASAASRFLAASANVSSNQQLQTAGFGDIPMAKGKKKKQLPIWLSSWNRRYFFRTT